MQLQKRNEFFPCIIKTFLRGHLIYSQLSTHLLINVGEVGMNFNLIGGPDKSCSNTAAMQRPYKIDVQN